MFDSYLGAEVVAERAGASRAGGHEEVLSAAREVDELLLVAADRKVELGTEDKLAGLKAVLIDEDLILGQTCVGEGHRGGLAWVPADKHALMVGNDVIT